MLRDMNPYPYIRGECRACQCVYDLLRDGMKCPQCGKIDLRWASMNNPSLEEPKDNLCPYNHELNYRGNACADSCPACFYIEETLPKIKELERMFTLEDPR